MIVGDGLDYSELYSALQEVESRLRRKIDPIFLSARDWRRKAAEKNSLVAKINASPKMFIIGSEKDL